MERYKTFQFHNFEFNIIKTNTQHAYFSTYNVIYQNFFVFPWTLTKILFSFKRLYAVPEFNILITFLFKYIYEIGGWIGDRKDWTSERLRKQSYITFNNVGKYYNLLKNVYVQNNNNFFFYWRYQFSRCIFDLDILIISQAFQHNPRFIFQHLRNAIKIADFLNF